MPDAQVAEQPERVVVAVGRRRAHSVPSSPSTRRSTSAGVGAVVEHRLADELDLHLALDALDRAHEQVVGVVVGRRARVARSRARCRATRRSSARRARRSQPCGVIHVVSIMFVPGIVAPAGRHVDAVGPDAEAARRRGRAARRRPTASRSAAGTSTRSSRRGDAARRCGSPTGSRSRRSAGTARRRHRASLSRAAESAASGGVQCYVRAMSTATATPTLQNFIDGEFVDPAEGATEDGASTRRPARRSPRRRSRRRGRRPRGGGRAAGVRRLVADDARASARERCCALADAIEEHGDEIAELEALNAGKPLQAVERRRDPGDGRQPALLRRRRAHAWRARPPASTWRATRR